MVFQSNTVQFLCPIILTESEYYAINLQIIDVVIELQFPNQISNSDAPSFQQHVNIMQSTYNLLFHCLIFRCCCVMVIDSLLYTRKQFSSLVNLILTYRQSSVVDHILPSSCLHAQVWVVASSFDTLAKSPRFGGRILKYNRLLSSVHMSVSALLPVENCYLLLQLILKYTPYLLMWLF